MQLTQVSSICGIYPGPAVLIITLGIKANRMDKAVNTFTVKEVIIMHRYNAAQWRVEQEAKHRMRELESTA